MLIHFFGFFLNCFFFFFWAGGGVSPLFLLLDCFELAEIEKIVELLNLLAFRDLFARKALWSNNFNVRHSSEWLWGLHIYGGAFGEKRSGFLYISESGGISVMNIVESFLSVIYGDWGEGIISSKYIGLFSHIYTR